MNLNKFKYSLTVNFLFKVTNKMKEIMESKLKTACKQQQINLEMQQQTNMLNLFVEFGFQLFKMKTLFYLKPTLNKQVEHVSLSLHF